MRMIQLASLDEKRNAHWLLTTEIIEYPLLNLLLNVHSKEYQDRQIHSRVHQSKRTPCRSYAVKGRDGLKRTQVNLDIRQIPYAPANLIGGVFAAARDYETHVSLFA